MGRPKALLRVGSAGPTFVDQLKTSLLAGGVADVLVVGRPDDAALIRELETLESAIRFVPNDHADEGQLSSVLAGLNAADRPGVAGILVTPVDAPLIRPSTIKAVLAALATGHAPIVRAVYRGRHGHPVAFRRSVFDDLRRADPAIGAKAVVQAHALDRLDLEVDDPGVVHDIDSPEDYARLVNGGR